MYSKKSITRSETAHRSLNSSIDQHRCADEMPHSMDTILDFQSNAHSPPDACARPVVKHCWYGLIGVSLLVSSYPTRYATVTNTYTDMACDLTNQVSVLQGLIYTIATSDGPVYWEPSQPASEDTSSLLNMASAAVHQSAGAHTTSFEPLTSAVQGGVTKHHVQTKLNYYKPNADGSPPAPAVSIVATIPRASPC